MTDPALILMACTDLDGLLRAKQISTGKLAKGIVKDIGFCDVVFGWDCQDQLYTNSLATGWHTGYPDARLRVDESTRQVYPWQENTVFFLGDFSADEHLHAICPRAVLMAVLDRLSQKGLQAKAGFEYEWYNFVRSEHSGLQPLSSGMHGYSLLRYEQADSYPQSLWEDAVAFGVPLEGLHTETGDGIWEAAIEAADPLTAADRAIRFKHAVRSVAHRHDITASFLARWCKELPGNGGHLHLSLWKDQEPLLSKEGNQLTALGQHFLAGILAGIPTLCTLYAPRVNSYKRLVPGSWAATTVSWGKENRTTAIRIIGIADQLHIELRVPGADANPYLVLAAALASGLHGIEQTLPLTLAAVQGSAYDTAHETLPSHLGQAIRQAEQSTLLEELLGAPFAKHYLYTRRWEWEQYLAAITDWEIERYLEV